MSTPTSAAQQRDPSTTEPPTFNAQNSQLTVLYSQPDNVIIMHPAAGGSTQSTGQVRIRILDADTSVSPAGMSDTTMTAFPVFFGYATYLETVANNEAADVLAAGVRRALGEMHAEKVGSGNGAQQGMGYDFKEAYERAKRFQ